MLINEKKYKKIKVTQIIITILAILSVLGAFVVDNRNDSNVAVILIHVYFCLIVIKIILLFIEGGAYFRKILIRNYLLLLLLIILLFVPQVIKRRFFPNDSFELNTIIQFYVAYLSFAGAAILGYAVYLNGVKKEERLIQKNAQILFDNLRDIGLWLARLDNEDSVDEAIDIIDWKKYYYRIYTAIDYNEEDIRCCLDVFYKMVESINLKIKVGKIDDARVIYKDYFEKELKNTSAYNFIEMELMVYSIANPKNRQFAPWYTKKSVRGEISSIKKQYEDSIYQWIDLFFEVNELKEYDSKVIESLLFEWLIKKDDIKKWITDPFGKRKIVKVIE